MGSGAVIFWPEMDEAIRQGRAAGQSWPAISKRVGVSTRVITRRARELGIDTKSLSSGRFSGQDVVQGRLRTRPLPAWSPSDPVPVTNLATIASRIRRGMNIELAQALPLQLVGRGGRLSTTLTPQKAEALRVHREAGMSWNAIGRALGVSRWTVMVWAKGLGVLVEADQPREKGDGNEEAARAGRPREAAYGLRHSG